MPYKIKKAKGKRPYQIINMDTGKMVGTSMTMKKAKGSIAHRMEAKSDKANQSKSKSPKKRIVRKKKSGRDFKPLTNKERK